VRLGRVYENWMVYVALSNQKLRRRGARILEEAAGVSASVAARALRQTGHDLPAALVMLKSGTTARESKRLLANYEGNVRRALEASSPVRNRMRSRGK
jgi:N-acetylmuramic acid 6-phosphate etherase